MGGMETIPDVAFYSSMSEIPNTEGPKLALIAGRTSDNPKLFKDAIDQGFSHIFLEKPGASTVQELLDMKQYACAKGVPVCMGFNKNVTKYVSALADFFKSCVGGNIILKHGNSYTP